MPDDVVTMDKIVSLCKRRGFIFPSSEIYGGIAHHLRLRALRRPAEEERQERVVAGDAPRARRHRRARLGDHPAPAHVGGQRPPRRLHRPARRLPHVQAALPRRPPRREQTSAARASRASSPGRGRRTATSPRRASSTSCSRRRSARSRRPASTAYLRPETAQGIFLNFKNVLQFARRSRRSGSRRSASRSATRSRRATSSSARASSSRWRWSSSSRPTRRTAGTSTGCEARIDWYERLGIRARPPAPARARAGRAVPLLERRRATSSTCSPSAGRSSRASPTAATSTSPSTPSTPARSSSTSTSSRASATSRT